MKKKMMTKSMRNAVTNMTVIMRMENYEKGKWGVV